LSNVKLEVHSQYHLAVADGSPLSVLERLRYREMVLTGYLMRGKSKKEQSTKYKAHCGSDGYTSAALQKLSVPGFAFERAVVHHYFAA